ncbi:uncharacterized protein SETTUDRAFT_165284 [Exserohilum turcica Et28A]|uniref:Uncharacterized protein n=1 Tax=Exserohilum turcicum (strain 28A) TaxID=671987 RepID=R0ICJ2_EXST2|nr:uncharacterized protein SETTUDRAFT_165284 [Exserohilum turcica Et28A]EOA82921.1 hypothetical protein SETTUDRAFT_165284 [Exserohilum turcica Et28A]
MTKFTFQYCRAVQLLREGCVLCNIGTTHTSCKYQTTFHFSLQGLYFFKQFVQRIWSHRFLNASSPTPISKLLWPVAIV